MVSTSKEKYWVTGSDFSELALLETNLNELSNTMDNPKRNKSKLKMANFKQIDWT